MMSTKGRAEAGLCGAVVTALVMTMAGGALASEANVAGPPPNQIVYRADPNEANNVSIFLSGTVSNTFTIRDGGASIRAGHDCTATQDPHEVKCLLADVTELVLLGDDLNDVLDASGASLHALIGGGAGSDVMTGSSVTDLLAGNDDGDFLFGGDGMDALNGQDGPDRLEGQGDRDGLAGGAGDDELRGGDGDDQVHGMDGNDFLYGGPGADDLKGQGPNSCTDFVCGPDAPDTGFDAVVYADRTDPLFIEINGVADDGAAGEGDNVAGDIEYVVGGSNNDRIAGDGDAEVFEGRAGIDSLLGRGGADLLIGDEGDDSLFGGPGPDDFQGGPGRDLVHYVDRQAGVVVTIDGLANDGNVTDEASGRRDNVSTDVEDVTGWVGPDRLTGRGGAANVLHGWDGDDTLSGGEVACGQLCLVPLGDTLAGDLGVDTADYSARNVALTVTLDNIANDGAAGENDSLIDVENVTGGSAGDVLVGNAAANTLEGRIGQDDIQGQGGPDTLSAGFGFDLVRGGGGDDRIFSADARRDEIFCGAGTDSVIADGRDRIAPDCEVVTR